MVCLYCTATLDNQPSIPVLRSGMIVGRAHVGCCAIQSVAIRRNRSVVAIMQRAADDLRTAMVRRLSESVGSA